MNPVTPRCPECGSDRVCEWNSVLAWYPVLNRACDHEFDDFEHQRAELAPEGDA